jgi:hypothetical protein
VGTFPAVRAFLSVIGFVLTVIAAAVIGFGVPLLWIWIGSQLQGDTGATNVDFSVAMAVLFGIILTYVLLLYLAGVVMHRFDKAAANRPATARAPWMRGMTDTRQRPGESSMGNVERVFVVTTMIVTAAFWLWFAFKAGSPLPNQ